MISCIIAHAIGPRKTLRKAGFRTRLATAPLPARTIPCAAREWQRLDHGHGDYRPESKAAPVALWGERLPIQRCTVHKHRNLLAHAPKRLHDELTEDYRGH
jgi:hypothetical protein